MVIAVIVFLGAYLAGCDGVIGSPSQLPLIPTPVVVKYVTQAVENTAGSKTETGTAIPADENITLAVPAVTSTPTWILEPLSTALEIKDIHVSLISESSMENTPDQTCTYSLDNLFTCDVPESGYRAIRISFVVDRHENLTLEDFERTYGQALIVIYPYKTVSRYTVEPPVGKADIIDDNNGIYHADFKLDSPYAAFTFYILVDGTSIAGSNLYLK
jgi:hypothetical protein